VNGGGLDCTGLYISEFDECVPWECPNLCGNIPIGDQNMGQQDCDCFGNVYDQCGVCGGAATTCPCSSHSDCDQDNDNAGRYCHSDGYCKVFYHGYCRDNPCYEGDGDCDTHNPAGQEVYECDGGTTCGSNNCDFGNGITETADCCFLW